MAILPLVPQNVYVQAGNGKILISWSISLGATSYSVQRSTDGINFTTVGSPTATQYLDSSITVGVQYYYQVASVNSTGTSGYSAPQSIIAANEGQLPLGNLRLMCQQRADMVNSQFVSLPEWNSFINQAYYELYDLLIKTYEYYAVQAPYTFTADGVNQQFDLPNDFYKLLGVDLSLGTGATAWISLKQFNFIDRNSYVYPQLQTTALGVFNPRYEIIGNTIFLIPIPPGGQQFRLWYAPRLTQLLQDTDIMDGVSGWTQYVIARAAKYALDKEESDTTKLDAELLFLKDRIESTAQNRDAGQPATVANTRLSFNNWGSNGDGWSNGSWGGF